MQQDENSQIIHSNLAQLVKYKHSKELERGGADAQREILTLFDLAEQLAESNPGNKDFKALRREMYEQLAGQKLNLEGQVAAVEKRSKWRDFGIAVAGALFSLLLFLLDRWLGTT